MDYWGGGGAKGMLAPLSNYWGPGLPTPMKSVRIPSFPCCCFTSKVTTSVMSGRSVNLNTFPRPFYLLSG